MSGSKSSNASPARSTDDFPLSDGSVPHQPVSRFLKRNFDILVSSSLLVVLLLFLPFIAFTISRDGGPLFFVQKRIGKDGKIFLCYKFRSMHMEARKLLKQHLLENTEAAHEWNVYQKLKNDIRVTKVGRFIRRFSIDEWPQLINVLKGNMSLVGPRPIMLVQKIHYAEDFVYYKSVLPGITGPWQVGGRNTLTFQERVELESHYIRNWNLWTDIVILFKTIPAILKKEQAF